MNVNTNQFSRQCFPHDSDCFRSVTVNRGLFRPSFEIRAEYHNPLVRYVSESMRIASLRMIPSCNASGKPKLTLNQLSHCGTQRKMLFSPYILYNTFFKTVLVLKPLETLSLEQNTFKVISFLVLAVLLLVSLEVLRCAIRFLRKYGLKQSDKQELILK